jgi:HK97 family phage portal protein
VSLFSRRQTREISGPFAGMTPEALIPRRAGGANQIYVDNDTALRHSAVWACLRLRADLLSTMPLDVFTRFGAIQVQMPTAPVLINPDGEDVGILEWLYSSQVDLDRAGNCFGLITERNAWGLPSRIELQTIDYCSVRVRNGVKKYRIANKEYDPSQVWHERQFTVAGLPVGLSPIAYAAWAIREYLSLEKFALDWFGGGAIPSVHLKNTARTLKTGEAIAVKEQYRSTVNAGDAFVSGTDWDLNPIQAVEQGIAWIEAQKFGVGDIARFFGCPGDLIDAMVSGRSITYANITQRNLQFLIMNLGPAVIRREAALSKLVPSSRYVKLNTDAILRMDTETRVATQAVQIAARTLAPSEAREQENKPPFTAAQKQEFIDLFGDPGAQPAVAAGPAGKPKPKPNDGTPNDGASDGSSQ